MSKPAVKLHIDWCSFDAAKFAVERWHYSHSMPAGKRVHLGIWEDGELVGAIVYGYGANQHLGKAFNLKMTECVELCRVAMMHAHKAPVTRCVAISLRMLKKQSPGVRLVISYADCDQNHHGGIYAGGNWVYLGKVQINGGTPKYRIHGKVVHGRQIYSLYGRGAQQIDWLRRHVDPKAEKVFTLGKQKYAYPLDDEMRRALLPLARPYPKRAGSKDGVAPVSQTGGGGSIPTPALHSNRRLN